jgi:cytochrome b561
MRPDDKPAETYSPAARMFHWITFGAVAVMVPLGIAMDYRGNDLNIWDATTNNMYSAHKLIGALVLLLVIARLAYRLSQGAPADEPTLEPWQKVVSHLTHWGLYGLLLLVPLLGWFGVQYYPALDVFGLFNLPAVVAPNEATAGVVLTLHKAAAFLLVLLAAMHVGAALFHYVIRKDGVLNRMWPSLPRRDGK